MLTKYRVDRVAAISCVCQCGMNSILYIGSSLSEARKAFYRASSGLDTWGKPNIGYGVGLFTWRDGDYRRIGFKDSSGSSYMETL